MTVGELREILEDLDAEIPVQLQTQQHWPFINEISHMILKSELVDEDKDTEDEHKIEDEDVLYLVEGSQLSYGNKGAWNR